VGFGVIKNAKEGSFENTPNESGRLMRFEICDSAGEDSAPPRGKEDWERKGPKKKTKAKSQHARRNH